MPIYTSKDLKIQDKAAEENTYRRAPKATPSIEKIDDFHIIIHNETKSMTISRLEECILMIIADFTYTPVWLIKNWVDSIAVVDSAAEEMIEGFIETGLCYTENSTTGVYLRPTRFLLDWFEEDKKYIDICYNLLTHTLSEEQVMFDIIYGNDDSELYYLLKKENEMLPVFSPIHLETRRKDGTICIRENKFRIGMKGLNEEELIDKESKIMEQIKEQKEFTNEFSDLSQFLIVHRVDGKLGTQCPDLAIPIKRNAGKPKSWAIEIELTPKHYKDYVRILKAYKNNIKYGTLVYMCAPGRIAGMLKKAYEEIGGSLGYTQMKILEFNPPALDIDYFFNDNIRKQKRLNKYAEQDREEKEEQIAVVNDLFKEIQQPSSLEIIE